MLGGGGVQSHFRVKPKLRLGKVELRLGWGFDNFCLTCLEASIKQAKPLLSAKVIARILLTINKTK